MEQRSTPLRGEGSGVRNKLSAGRLMARDINESLGKLPPQAPDLEEAILGGLMLEKGALPIVQQFLKPHHFYVEAHKIIYEAILGLAAEQLPIDMLTVKDRLQTLGKLELVEGAYKIAELTSKVSSAANIEYYARVVMEKALKRSLIEIASQIHTEAYDDTTDVFDLLDKTDIDLKTAKDGTLVQTDEDRVKTAWETIMITTRPPDVPALLMLGECTVSTPGNHSLIVGKKKSRKTLLVVLLISQYLKNNPYSADQVIIFDTEQGKPDVFALREKIFKASGKLVATAYLRGQSPRERKDFIRNTVAFWPKKPKIIVIDGVRDLMVNINDPEESTEVIVWLEKLTLQHDLHVMDVLHLNKTDGNARGHIGSELLNKAECTIEVEFDENTGHSIVKCESSRRKPFETFAFTHGPDGMPLLVDVPNGKGNPSRNTKITQFQAVFKGNNLDYATLIEHVQIHFDCAIAKAKRLIRDARKDGWIIKSGAEHSKDTLYSLIISPDVTPIAAIHQLPAEPIHPPKEPEIDVSDLPF